MKYNKFMEELDNINILEQELDKVKRNFAREVINSSIISMSPQRVVEDYPLLLEDKKITLECSECGQVLDVNESECIYIGNYECPPEYSEPTLSCNNPECKAYGKILNIV